MAAFDAGDTSRRRFHATHAHALKKNSGAGFKKFVLIISTCSNEASFAAHGSCVSDQHHTNSHATYTSRHATHATPFDVVRLCLRGLRHRRLRPSNRRLAGLSHCIRPSRNHGVCRLAHPSAPETLDFEGGEEVLFGSSVPPHASRWTNKARQAPVLRLFRAKQPCVAKATIDLAFSEQNQCCFESQV